MFLSKQFPENLIAILKGFTKPTLRAYTVLRLIEKVFVWLFDSMP